MISIIVPVYNAEKYLNQCLESIIAQNFSDFEIICVNDGSTDNSLKILEDFAKMDNRIKIINQENKGSGYARNVGFNNSKGDYILFVDSDDFLSPNVLGELYSNAVLTDSDMVLFRFNKYDEFKNECIPSNVHFSIPSECVEFNEFIFSYKYIKNHVMNSYFAVWSKLYKRELIEKNELYFPDIAYDDVLYHIKSLLYANSLSYFPRIVYNYRMSNFQSIMHDYSKIFVIFEVCDSVENFLKESSFFDEFQEEFLIFKITQLSQYIVFSSNDDYLNKVKIEFESMENNYKLNNLPIIHKNIFDKVLSSENLDDYLNSD